jgi:Baseplate J-like protein
MALTTNVPFPTLGDNGFVLPTQQAVLDGVIADMQAAFGGNLNFTTTSGAPVNSTPQAQWATSLAAMIYDCFAQEVALFNGVDPAFATGRMQDAIARIYFLTRNPALPTVVQCLCSGAVGTPIPLGALAQDQSGNTYYVAEGVSIPPGGHITVPFNNQTPGPIPCPAGTLTKIFQAIPGWDSITNPGDGVIGQDAETTAQFEQRREDSVQANSIGQIGSIIGAVAEVEGVLDYYGIDNPTVGAITYLGQLIPAYGMFIAAAGGTNSDIAQAILTKRGPGTPMAGNTTVTAYDANPLYVSPVPYQITFERPASLPIAFAVVIKNGPGVPNNATALVQQAIINAFAGETAGVPRARIGSEIFASSYYGAVAALGGWAQIISILIGSPNTALATFTATIAGTLMTVASIATGALVVGQTITGANVLPGTTVVSFGTGTGGTGTYNVSTGQTISVAEPMTSFAASADTVQVNINQIPTIDPANISLTLT